MWMDGGLCVAKWSLLARRRAAHTVALHSSGVNANEQRPSLLPHMEMKNTQNLHWDMQKMHLSARIRQFISHFNHLAEVSIAHSDNRHMYTS